MANSSPTIGYQQSLIQAGLSQEQASIYEVLIKNGPLPAGKIHQKTPYKRGLVYKLLEQLEQSGLVIKKDEPGKVAIFEPAHPLKLKELAEKKEEEAKNAQTALGGVLSKLTSDFNLISGRPGVQFFEGVEGLKKIYDDILDTQKGFYFIRSIYEPTYSKQMLPIVERFIQNRTKLGIPATAITPRDEFAKGEVLPEDDKKILLNRTWVNKELYSAPVEIDIYGDKIALLSFGKELLGVIIQSPQISTALMQLFELARIGAKNQAPPQTAVPTASQNAGQSSVAKI